jgi:methyl-accepting chemotaxis protein
MKWFYDLKIAAKLIVAFVVVLLLTAALGVFAIIQLARVNAASTELATNWMPSIKAASDMKYDLARLRAGTGQLILANDSSSREYFSKSVNNTLEQLAKDEKRYESLISEPEERAAYGEYVRQREAYMPQQKAVMDAAINGRSDEAATVLRGQSSKLFGSMSELVNKIVKINEDGGDRASKRGDDLYASARIMIIAVLIGAVVIGLALAFWLSRLISTSLKQAVAVAQTVAAGDLTSQIRVTSKDETGQLLQALQDMNRNLVAIVSEVRTGTDTIATASNQIASGNLDLSSRTEQQASSLEETASSMEELTSTVKQNADNAQQANQLAASASQVAGKGGAVVSQVVTTMASINDSSKKIVDIIAVIDGIAFQTNILALNAAVEAARAGEQGRGFAVVASEVRSLAQRSATAAKEIKELIDDSVSKVDTGSKLVNEAGTTMQEIVQSIQRVTDIMSEITAASTEQSAGIEQINQAVTEMDNVTQQNAALVEEASAAAQAMQDQAAKLMSVVSRFKLDGMQARTAAPVLAATVARPVPKHIAKPVSAAKAPPRMIAKPAAERGESVPKILTSASSKNDEWEEF